MLKFLRAQVDRLAVRWFVMRYAVLSVAFWTLALTVGAWLDHFGLAWVGVALLAVWTYLALPSLIVQSALLLDLGVYGLTGELYAFPRMVQIAADASSRVPPDRAPTAPKRTALRLFERLCMLAGDTLPLIGLATWALVVIVRTDRGREAFREARERAMQQRDVALRANQGRRVRQTVPRELAAESWLDFGTTALADDASVNRRQAPRRADMVHAVGVGRRIEGAVVDDFARRQFGRQERSLAMA